MEEIFGAKILVIFVHFSGVENLPSTEGRADLGEINQEFVLDILTYRCQYDIQLEIMRQLL